MVVATIFHSPRCVPAPASTSSEVRVVANTAPPVGKAASLTKIPKAPHHDGVHLGEEIINRSPTVHTASQPAALSFAAVLVLSVSAVNTTHAFVPLSHEHIPQRCLQFRHTLSPLAAIAPRR